MMKRNAFVLSLSLVGSSALAQKGSESILSSPVPDGCMEIPENTYPAPTNGTIGMVCRPISVPSGTINNPELVLGLTHTWIGDLTVKVVPPSGVPIVTIFNRPGRSGSGVGSSANFEQTHPITFRDTSPNDPETMGFNLTTSQAVCRDGPQLCNFRTNRDEEVLPNVSNLAALNGQAAGGNWLVCVGDGAEFDTGSLCAATINPNTAMAQTCPPGNPRVALDGRYTDHGNGTVTDRETGLMWKRCGEGQSGLACAGNIIAVNWQTATQTAAATSFAGHSDWRLPSVKELQSLVETGCHSPSINITLFPNTPTGGYWSSTTIQAGPSFAWYVHFGNGGVFGDGNKSNFHAIRLVRAAQ